MVLEIVLGIAIGPQVLGWVSIDTPIQVMSLLGLAFLLLLAGLEVEYDRFRGRLLRLTALGYAMSFGLAALIGLGLNAGGLVKSPLLVAIVLSATSLGIVIPVLKRRSGEHAVRAARLSRRLDRRNRDDRPVVALLGRDQQRRREARAIGFSACLSSPLAWQSSAPSTLRVYPRHCSGSRTRRRKSGSARRSSCSRSSSCSPSGSNSRRFSAHSSRARS